MYEIKTSYKDNSGKLYTNVRDIHFEKLSDLSKGHGGFLYESNKSDSSSIFVKPYKVYIYRSLHSCKTALRIYDDFADYRFSYHTDNKLISQLQSKQKDIKLTEFPTGVITVENRVIGQEIPLYNNAITLTKLFKEDKLSVLPTHIYLEVLKILKELYKNGILYCDIHSNNFLIENETIKLIDFEDKYIEIDGWYKGSEENMIYNLKRMIQALNKLYGISFSENLDKAQNLDEVEECINQKNLKLLKIVDK